jgi:hypothetical protein
MRRITRRFGWLALCGAVIALAAAPAGQAATSHPPLFTIFDFGGGPEGENADYFEAPCGIAVRPDGGIYVSDYYHQRILSFGASGGYLPAGGTEVDPVDGPCGLAVLGNGDIAVNSFHRGVFSLTHPDEIGWTVPSSAGPSESTGVAYDPAGGHLYVNERTSVAVYDVTGLAPVEVMRIGEGSLADAYGVAVSGFAATDGFVYVPDAATDTIKVFDPTTSLDDPVQTIDGKGTPQGGLFTLHDAAVAVDDATGNLFLVRNVQGPYYEHPLAAVAEFNRAGEYRGTVPLPFPLWFGEPSGIAVDNTGGPTQGRVYVTSGNSEVENPKIPEQKGPPPVPGNPGKPEEGSVLAFGPTAPGKRLEVNVTGPGSVASSPAGIACPGACAAEYDEGSTVELTATPAAGSAFAGWSGGGCSGTGTCTVSIGAEVTVNAEFVPAPLAAEVRSAPANPTAPVAATGGGAAPAAAAAGSSPAGAPAGSGQRRRTTKDRNRKRAAKKRRGKARHHRHAAIRKDNR